MPLLEDFERSHSFYADVICNNLFTFDEHVEISSWRKRMSAMSIRFLRQRYCK
jgi:hypothetical protein